MEGQPGKHCEKLPTTILAQLQEQTSMRWTVEEFWHAQEDRNPVLEESLWVHQIQNLKTFLEGCCSWTIHLNRILQRNVNNCVIPFH